MDSREDELDEDGDVENVGGGYSKSARQPQRKRKVSEDTEDLEEEAARIADD
jgi:hypothetical protein